MLNRALNIPGFSRCVPQNDLYCPNNIVIYCTFCFNVLHNLCIFLTNFCFNLCCTVITYITHIRITFFLYTIYIIKSKTVRKFFLLCIYTLVIGKYNILLNFSCMLCNKNEAKLFYNFKEIIVMSIKILFCLCPGI